MRDTREGFIRVMSPSRRAEIVGQLAAQSADLSTRDLPRDAVEAAIAGGFLRMLRPAALGGEEMPLVEFCEAIEEVSYWNASLGWNLMVWGGNAALLGYLEQEAAREVFAESEQVIAVAFDPSGGRAQRVADGFLVSGRWHLVSGCTEATWVALACLQPGDGDSAQAETYLFLVPRSAVEFISGRHGVGLAATGTHDVQVTEILVADSCRLALEEWPTDRGAYWAGPIRELLSPPVAAVALGIARRALEAFERVAQANVRTSERRPLVDDPVSLRRVGEAYARFLAARALFFGAVNGMWDRRMSGRRPTDLSQAALQLALAETAQGCAEAVRAMLEEAGSTSMQTGNAFEAAWRDIAVLLQHITVSRLNYRVAGRVFLASELAPTTARYDLRLEGG